MPIPILQCLRLAEFQLIRGDVITVTVTKPVTITEHGTIRTTVTGVVLAETIYQSTITHVNEIGKTVTEIVHYTTTLEVTGGSTIPFQVMPTLETRYETIVNGHTEYIVTHIGDVTTQTNGEVHILLLVEMKSQLTTLD